MKIALYEIENRVDIPLMEEAMDLVRETREYDLTSPEPGYHHFISRNPDYHVEIRMGADGMAQARCQCAVFRKSRQCRHAVAALLILRNQILGQKRAKVSAKPDRPDLDEVLQKMKVSELRSFIAAYAASHMAFRAEVLAQYLHLLRKPDYPALLAGITPIDKYGQIKLNRNNIKTVRNIISILIRQAQQLLNDMALREVLQILQPVMAYLYRMIQRMPQFREQFMTELRQTSRLFEALCRHSMAPRLQEMAMAMALDISSREGYVIPKGTMPLLISVEPFFLEEKKRKEAFHLAYKKWAMDPGQALTWGCMALHWMRLWPGIVHRPKFEPFMQKMLPEIILEFSRQGAPEDILYAIQKLDRQDYENPMIKAALQAGIRAARQTGELALLEELAFEVSLHYLDPDARDLLVDVNPVKATRVIETISALYSPGADPVADHFLLRGWSLTGHHREMLERLRRIGNIDWLPMYDKALIPGHREELEDLYANRIHEMRETYGGTIARQKLSTIFGHLKSTALYPAVAEKIKHMDKNASENTNSAPVAIKGFVFDLDGVIVDTAAHHFQSWKKVMKQLGADIAEEDDAHTRGASRMESLEYLLHRYHIQLTPEEKEMWAAKKNDLYLESIEQITPLDLLPGALAFLTQAKNAGLRLALGSASKNARGVLKKLQIEDRFDAILDGFDAASSKPHPEIFIKACQALALDPSTVVVFEDAAKGVQAAIAAGCKVVGLGDPGTLKEADLIVRGLDQITPAQILEQLA